MKVEVLGTIPNIATAIKVHGEGGMRITVDIPETEMGRAIAIVGLRGKTLKVTLEPEEMVSV